jgi:two-component system nitrogen regulation response regulator NtrX
MKVLIVDDDVTLCDTLSDILTMEGYPVEWVNNGSRALEMIQSDSVDLVLLDLLLPGMNGLEVMKEILKTNPEISVIMMSGHGTIQDAVEAVHAGAYEWLEKPLKKDRVLLTLSHVEKIRNLLAEKKILISEAKSRYRMVGVSPAIKKIYEMIDKVAGQRTTILITGESGTGKELVARAIHLNSERAAAPFVEVNCAAIPDTLIESELFGYVKGSFTGAEKDALGKFQLSNHGTLFLDEIGDLDLRAQAKVLKTIETGVILRIGNVREEKVDLRIVCATNQDLRKMIRKGNFRQDLYHRINVIEISIPPLRNRPEDIIPLADHFLETFCRDNNIEKKKLTPDAESMLLASKWPGNVRELRNFIERLTVLVEGVQISAKHVATLLSSLPVRMGSAKPRTLMKAKQNFEKGFIRQALETNGWNLVRTAEMIDISRSLLYRKMEKYGLRQKEE